MTTSTILADTLIPNRLEHSSFGVATSFRGKMRLSTETRALAAQYLSGDIGRTIEEADFAVASEFLETNPSANQHVTEAVRLIATHAPLRILPYEKLVGAATLKEAMAHQIPLTEYGSISHTTLGFEKALQVGYRGIREDIDERLARGDLDEEGVDLLQSMLICLDATLVWHGRYIVLLEERIREGTDTEQRHYTDVLESFRRVPEHPPETFREGIQALWLLWDFQRLCGNWSGVGRIDKMLGPLLRSDLDAGRIDLDEARELLAHFWIKGCEWITAEGTGSGDAQFYQNVVLGGVDESGLPVANEVTELVLDVVEELHISDFPIAVRIDAKTPIRLLNRIAEIQRLGGGIISVYNDDRIISTLVEFGYPLDEARNYANDGCWEILIPGKTAFSYQPFDALLLLQETLGLTTPEADHTEYDDSRTKLCNVECRVDFADFESLYTDFSDRLTRKVDQLTDINPLSKEPCPLLSMLVEGCIERGRGYLDGGPVYTALSPHAGGLPDVANSLLVIKRLVYEKQDYTLLEFVDILRLNWGQQEPLRRSVQHQFDFYGNDNDETDALLQRVFDDYTGAVGRHRERHSVLRPAGISTFGREGSTYLPHRTATASGQKTGAILAANFSPAPGTERDGPTAVIRSHCSVDFSRLPCGTALDLKIAPDSVRGDTGITALTGLMRGFVRLGGIFMQIDVVDTELLRKAQAHPDDFPNLTVRISGWSARFATLSREWQDMVIARTEHLSEV
jgi:pyruvate-formate lyase